QWAWCDHTPPVSAGKTAPVAVIGAALDLGAGRRGVDMGPSAIRYAGLAARIRSLGRDCVDFGNVQAEVPEAAPVGDERRRYLDEIKATCACVAEIVARVRSDGTSPLAGLARGS